MANEEKRLIYKLEDCIRFLQYAKRTSNWLLHYGEVATGEVSKEQREALIEEAKDSTLAEIQVVQVKVADLLADDPTISKNEALKLVREVNYIAAQQQVDETDIGSLSLVDSFDDIQEDIQSTKKVKPSDIPTHATSNSETDISEDESSILQSKVPISIVKPSNFGLGHFLPNDPLLLNLSADHLELMSSFVEKCNAYARGKGRGSKFNNDKFFRPPYHWRNYGKIKFEIGGSIRSGLHIDYPGEDISDLDLVITSDAPVVPYEGLRLQTIAEMLLSIGGEGSGHLIGKDNLPGGDPKPHLKPTPWTKDIFQGKYMTNGAIRFLFDIGTSTDSLEYTLFLEKLFSAYVELRRAMIYIKYFVKMRKMYGSKNDHITCTGYTTLFILFLQQKFLFPSYREIKWAKDGTQVENWRGESAYREDFVMTGLLIRNFSNWFSQLSFKNVIFSFQHSVKMTKEEFKNSLLEEGNGWMTKGYDDSKGYAWIVDPINYQNQGFRSSESNIALAQEQFKGLTTVSVLPMPDFN